MAASRSSEGGWPSGARASFAAAGHALDGRIAPWDGRALDGLPICFAIDCASLDGCSAIVAGGVARPPGRQGAAPATKPTPAGGVVRACAERGRLGTGGTLVAGAPLALALRLRGFGSCCQSHGTTVMRW